MSSAEDYLATIEDERRRADAAALHALIREELPDLEVEASERGGIGYGPFHYRYATGREGDTYVLSLVNRKAGISLYVMCVHDDGQYVAERYVDRLPQASIGKSCVRIKRLSDVDTDVVRELLREAGRTPPAGAVA